MLYPAMSELLKHVDSRYLLVNVVAHRCAGLCSRTYAGMYLMNDYEIFKEQSAFAVILF